MNNPNFHSLPKVPFAELDRRALAVVDTPWLARCPKHDGVEDPGPCVDCGGVRQRAGYLRAERSNRLEREREARRAEVRSCSWCDSRGLVAANYPDGAAFMVRCPHDGSALANAVDEAVAKWGAERREREARLEESGKWLPRILAKVEARRQEPATRPVASTKGDNGGRTHNTGGKPATGAEAGEFDTTKGVAQ